VTTRWHRRRPRWPNLRAPVPEPPSVAVVGVPRRRVPAVHRDQLDVFAAAWPPANDARHPGIPAPGSTVGCIAVPETSARIPSADKFAIPAAAPWRASLLCRYAATVPWEVTTPWGRPGRMVLILLGHSPIDAFVASPVIADDHHLAPPPVSKQGRTTRTTDLMLPAEGEDVKHHEEDGEGHVPDAFLP